MIKNMGFIKKFNESDDDDAEVSSKKKKRLLAAGAAACLLLGGVAVALAVVFPREKDATKSGPPKESQSDMNGDTSQKNIFDEAESEAEADVRDSQDILLSILTPYTAEETLLDSTTPQGQAFGQLIEELDASDSAADKVRVQQRYALMSTYFATNGDSWTNRDGWDTFSENECDWYGISNCKGFEDGTKTVTGINLGKNNLEGPIPSELCALPDSDFFLLDLGENNLGGNIPECIIEFRSLENLQIFNAQLSGDLPAGLLTLPVLTKLQLYNNDFSGTLDVLFEETYSHNNGSISKYIDSSFASMLQDLRLHNNMLEGTIPAQFGNFHVLKSLHLWGNDLTGGVEESGVCELRKTEDLQVFEADCQEIGCTCCSDCK